MKKLVVIALTILATSAFGCTMSSTGINHLKNFEKCSLTAYRDANGFSIGWGHHTGDIRKGMKITKEQADKFLRNDIKTAEKYADYLIDQLPYDYKFSTGFYDGLIDMIYNAGIGSVKNSSFFARLKKCRVSHGKMNKADLEYTLASVKTFNITAEGHKARRLATYNMMKK